MSNQEHTDGLTRRTLIKSTALGSLAPRRRRFIAAFQPESRRCRGDAPLTARSVSSGAPVRSTAAAAAPSFTRA